MNGKVSIVVIGAGHRTSTYLEYVRRNADKVCVVGVVEPNDFRRDRIADEFSVPYNLRMRSLNEFYNLDKFAEAVIIATPDHLHYQCAIEAINKGYHILLEKPIAQTMEQSQNVAALAEKHGLVVGVCHVLRYHPIFVKIKELIECGNIGEVITITHSESIGIDRMTHAFVRGPWGSSTESGPIVLVKTSHDIDILLWFAAQKCKKLTSMGSLMWFIPQKAPAGSAERCVNCSIENSCPYSAIDLYKRRKKWLRHFDTQSKNNKDEIIERELNEGNYGRCVYHCGNDVCDHQSVVMQMENGMIINLTLDVFTSQNTRKTHVMGSMGEIYGENDKVIVNRFDTKESQIFEFSHIADAPFHAGADIELVEDFINTIKNRNVKNYRVSIKNSLDSHLIAFEAENCRLTNSVKIF